MTLDSILEEIKKAQTIVILTHESPDGDAVGSSLALYLALKELNKKSVELIIPVFPKAFGFLPGVNEILKKGTMDSYDLVIALDVADVSRLNNCIEYFENSKVKISIDHHGSNTMFADYNFVNPTSAAAGQVLMVLFEYLQIELTKEIAECLYAAIVSDTGGLKYQNVTVDTFECVQILIKKGINSSEISRKMIDIMTYPRFNLTRLALDRLEFFEDGKIAFTYINLEDEKKFDAGEGDHEGIVNWGKDIEGVEVSIFLHESIDGYKVSLRSIDKVNVADICLLFNGGGHRQAAGCKLKMPLELSKQTILNEIIRALK